MTLQVIREFPKLLLTEEEPVELVSFLEGSSVFVKLGSSIRVLTLPNGAIDENSDIPSFPICGSEIGGGKFREICSDSKCGIVCFPAETTKHPLIPGFALCLKAGNDQWTVGSFEKKTETTPPIDHMLSVHHQSSDILKKQKDDMTSVSCSVYTLRRRLKLKKGESVLNICPISSCHNESANIAVLSISDQLPTDSQSKKSFSVQILSSNKLDIVVPSLSIPVLSSVDSGGSWNITCVLKGHDPDTEKDILVIWKKNDKESIVNGFVSVCFLSLSLKTAALNVLGWYKLSSPEDSDATLSSIKGVPLNSISSQSFLSPNVLITWTTGFYELFFVGIDNQSGLIVMPKIKHQAMCLPKNNLCLKYIIMSILPSIILEIVWDNNEGVLRMQMNHFVNNILFNYPSSEDHPSDYLHTCMTLGLPTPPKDITSHLDGNDITVLISTDKQIYFHRFRGIGTITSGLLFPQLTRPTVLPVLPSKPVLQSLGLNTVFVDIALKLINGEIKDIKENQKQIEYTIQRLVDCNIIELNIDIIDRLLLLNLHGCCRRFLQSHIVDEIITVYLMRCSNGIFLKDAILNLSATRQLLIKQLREQLTINDLEIMLRRLADWCEILTTLPGAMTNHSVSLPPLNRVADFVSILIDAKFRDMTMLPNEALTKSICDIAGSLADALVVKKNLQKLQGQLFSIVNSLQTSHLRTHESTPLIERVAINM